MHFIGINCRPLLIGSRETGKPFQINYNTPNSSDTQLKSLLIIWIGKNGLSALIDCSQNTNSIIIINVYYDRILGFRRTMPVIGRILNVTSEVFELANRNLTNTFFMSPEPEKNRCFYGTCSQYCSIHHPFCAKGDLIEVNINSYCTSSNQFAHFVHADCFFFIFRPHSSVFFPILMPKFR